MRPKVARYDRLIRSLGIPFFYSTPFTRVYKRGKLKVTCHLLKDEIDINGNKFPAQILLYPQHIRMIIKDIENGS